MKKSRILGLTVVLIVAAVMLAGCSSTSIITEYDAQGNITKKTETKESVVEQVIASTKDKTVIVFREFYMVGLRAEPSSENLFSLECAYMHKNTGVISVLKDQQNLDKIANIVYNMKQTDSVSATTSGVSSSSGNSSSTSSVSSMPESSTATTTATEAKQ